MVLHQAKINRRKGFSLAMTTTLMWAILPVTLKIVLQGVDPITTTWYRFSIAAVVITIGLMWRKEFPSVKGCRKVWPLWVTAILGLVTNHTVYVAGLDYLQPVSATIFIQLAPVFLLAGGLIIFRETFSIKQWFGLIILLSGMALFFLPELQNINALTREFLIGGGLIVIAAISWAAYALAQKQLLVHYSSQQIVAVIYISGTLFLLPGSSPAQVFELDTVRLLLLLFAGVNTVVAYGCFSEALNHWDASRVSALLTTIPVITLVLMLGAQHLFPIYVDPEPLTFIKFAGACIVMTGSMVCALAKRK